MVNDCDDAGDAEASATQPTTSLSGLVRCPDCSQARFFKGKRGLKVHFGKVHKTSQNVLSSTLSNTQDSLPPTPFWKTISKLKNSVPVLKRVPRGARPSVAKHLADCIGLVVRENSKQAWEQLLTFPYRILHVEKDPASKKSLTTQIKQNCSVSALISDAKFTFNQKSTLFQRVESKLRDGDIRGASRLLFSSDVVAPCSSDTIAGLKSKHPAPSDGLSFPDPPDRDSDSLNTTAKDVLEAVCSFRSGSAGGLDGLTPQHLKDLVCTSAGESGESLLRELTALMNLMLSGNVNDAIIDILYGANLCALIKKDGGIPLP